MSGEGKKAIVLYMHVHQPYRVRHYTIFDAGSNHNYFDADYEAKTNNERIMHKVTEKSYLPTNKLLLELLHKYPDFKLSLSISGTAIEQMQKYAPRALDSFRKLVATNRVEIVAETYHHSLAFFYSKEEFERQVNMHKEKVHEIFGQRPQVFRNTELAYNNDLAYWADKAGYKGILSEGWDPVLQWRSPNFVYRPAFTDNIRLLMKNYRLSDDIAFRFGNHDWSGWPLTADKFTQWLDSTHDADIFNLFMDYETFGEHQWSETGIFEFLKALPDHWSEGRDDHKFMTVSEAIDSFDTKDYIDTPNTVTWADTERDLSAWLGNAMQQQAISAIFRLEQPIIETGDLDLIADWRNLTTSDHFYYMCTKWFNDGDIHAYFSPYDSPYQAFIAYMNAWQDVRFRLVEKGHAV